MTWQGKQFPGMRLAVVWLLWAALAAAEEPVEMRLGSGSRVAIVGDGLALEMARYGYLETALHLAFPSANLSVRSFASEGFRVDAPPKSLTTALQSFDPDLILLSTGWNESFDGAERVAAFGTALRASCAAWGNGAALEAGPRIELIPPVTYLQHSPGMPNEATVTARLAPYLREMQSAAGESKRIGYVDTGEFTSLTYELTGEVSRDGRRLNRRGHWLLAVLLGNRLGLPQGGAGPEDPGLAEEVRQLVGRKETAWDASGRQGGERGRGWDQAIWSAPKPALASLWAVEPESLEVWPEATQTLGMPQPRNFGLAQRVEPSEALAGVRCSKLVRGSLWASEDGLEIWNPVSLRFDGEGRAWVGCAPPGLAPCVLRIEDADGDHQADRQRVFVSGAIHPEGFLPGADGLYVSTDTGLRWYLDKDRDGAADRWEPVLGGSSLRTALRWGADGGLWFQQAASSGEPVESPWGTLAGHSGGLIRWNPRTGQLNLRMRTGGDRASRPDLAFDPWGTPLVIGTREGRPLALDRVGDWAGEIPTSTGAEVFSASGGPGALLLGDHWPKTLRDTFVRAERTAAGRWEVAIYESGWDGSFRTWRRQPEPLFTSADANFFPVDLEAGPDGALYVLDACGKGSPLRAGSWGRIWRIAPARVPPVWAMGGTGKTIEEILEELCHAAPERGQDLRAELWRRPPGEVLSAWSGQFNALAANDPGRERLALEGLRLHQAFGARNPDLLAKLVDSPSPQVRYAACDVLADWFFQLPGSSALLQRLIEDENPRVRLAALNCARRAGTPAAGDLARLASHQRMDDDLGAVAEATVVSLGAPGQPPASLRAKAIATSTVDLIAGEMSPHVASVLLERSGVENSVLRQCAGVLSGRSGLSLEGWIVERLEDRNSPDDLLANLVKLLALTEGWELYQSGARLQAIADSTDRPSVRRAAYGALAIGAAESRTQEAFFEEIAAGGDSKVVGFFEGCAQVINHAKFRASIGPVVRNELADGEPDPPIASNRLRVVAPGWDVLHFAELEAFSGDRELAHGRPARQSESSGATRWWSTLAKNGVNGIKDWQSELPLKGLVPGSAPVRGVMAGKEAEGDPFWEVDLGDRVAIGRILYHPGEPLPAPRPLRFELLNEDGDVQWTSTRFTNHTGPLELQVDMSAQRTSAVVAVARLLGDDFAKSLETVARHSALLPARFSALRALRKMGSVPSGLRMRVVDVTATPEGFSQPSLGVNAQDSVELTVRNESGVELNLAMFEAREGAVPVVVLGRVLPGREERFPFVVPSRIGAYQIRQIEAPLPDRLVLRLDVSAAPPAPTSKK